MTGERTSSLYADRVMSDRGNRLAVRIVLAGLTVVLVWATFTSPSAPAMPLWRTVTTVTAVLVVVVALVLDVTWRRTDGALPRLRSLPVIVLSVAVTVLLLVAGGDTMAWLPIVVGVAAGRTLDPVPSALVALPPVAAGALVQWWSSGSVTALGTILTFVVVLSWVQLRRRQREATELTAAQAEIIAAERARSEAAERQREIAAHVHDVLAHTLSGLIISLQTATLQARAEQVSAPLQERLEAATGLAREGLAGARQAVESLTRDTPVPVALLGEWLEDHVRRLEVGAGLAVTTAGDPDAVPHSRVEVVRAVLLEATTNSLRHAGGAPVHIDVRVDRVVVLTEGAGRSDHRGGGHGLAGLRERVERSGAAFEAGPTDEGWSVSAIRPKEET